MSKRKQKTSPVQETASVAARPGPPTARRVLVGVLLLQLALGIIYWWYTPFGAPPDEGPHGKYIEALVDSRSLPVFRPEDRVHYEAHQPPLYYLMASPFYAAGKGAGAEEPASWARALSMLLSALSAVVTYAAVRKLFPDQPGVAAGAAGFGALLPSHVMVGSSVSNDILAEVIFGVTLLLLIALLREGPDARRTAYLGVALGLGLLTKTTCAILFPVAALGYALAAARGRASWSQALRHAGAAVGVGLLVGGWWLVRNRMLYGDFLAMAQFQHAFEHTARPSFFFERGASMVDYLLLVGTWTFYSFWGVFGHMNVFMPTTTYAGLGAASLAVVVGTIIAVRRADASDTALKDGLLVLAVTLALVAASFIQFIMMYFQAQGRYLYPALLPISTFWAMGVSALLPADRRRISWAPAVLVPILAQIVALATCIAPKMPGYHL